MYTLLFIAAGLSLYSLATAGMTEPVIFQTHSPDGRYALIWRAGEAASEGQVVLFDHTTKRPIGGNLSQTDHVFDLIAMSHKMSTETPEQYRPSYRVAWSEDADMVAIHAGFHQYSSVSLFHRTEQGLETVPLPVAATFKTKIEGDIAPFRLSKLSTSHPRWLSKRRLSLDVSGSAFREPAHSEADFLDIIYRVVIRVEDGQSIEIESIEKIDSPTSGTR